MIKKIWNILNGEDEELSAKKISRVQNHPEKIKEKKLLRKKEKIEAGAARTEKTKGNRKETREALIASFVMKKKKEKNPENKKSWYFRGKKLPRKEILFIILGLIILGGATGGGYFLKLKAQKETLSAEAEKKENSAASFPEEISNINQEGKEADADEASGLEENSWISENTSQDYLQEELDKNGENAEKIQPGAVSLKILNKGAPAERVSQTKKILIGQGYSRTKTAEGEQPDAVLNVVFFQKEKFRIEAQNIAQLLREKEEIHSYARPAGSDEEKSADIVIVLGKFKEAPPN